MDCNDILQEQDKWHREYNQACLYAGYITRKPNTAKWEKKCINLTNIKEIINDIDKKVKNAIDNNEIHVLSLIIPSISDKKRLSLFVETISDKTDWNINEVNAKQEGYKLIQATVPLKGYEKDYLPNVGWMISLGNFPKYPNTRKSPYFEIVLPVKPKKILSKNITEKGIDLRTTNPSEDVHIADMGVQNITDKFKRDKKSWQYTQKMTEEKLNDSGKKAYGYSKAKITFVLTSNT